MFRWILVALVMSSGSVLAQTPSSPLYGPAKAIKYPQQSATIEISVGHTQLLRLDRQFKSIIVGDPHIADVVAQDGRTVLITAKDPITPSSGPATASTATGRQESNTTNVIFLDNANEPIYSAEVVVSTPSPVDPLGRVKIYGVASETAGGKSAAKAADYLPWACTSKDCIRLKVEYQGEKSNDIFAPGVRSQPQPPIIFNNGSPPGS